MRKVQVGIDLGTTNTLAYCRVNGKMKLIKFKGKDILPSVLYVEKQADGSIKEIVGKAAKVKGLQDPDNCISSSKTYIGLTGQNKRTWKCHGKVYSPTDVATKILEEVHKKVRETYNLEAGDVVQAVITIPAYFTSTQSDETKRAGESAGMEVLRIITEPVAAAVAAGTGVQGKVFVVDLGGGTFDVSVLDIGQQYRTLEIDGERRLGGDDFDEILMKYFLGNIEDDLNIDLSSLEASGLSYQDYYVMMAKIRDEAIETKEALSEELEHDADIPALFYYGDNQQYDFSMIVTRDKFNSLCDPLFKRIIEVIDRTCKNSNKFKKSDLKKIFLVGGSCYIPRIQEDVENYFGMASDSEQDRATQVAIGAGKIADAWDGISTSATGVDPFDVQDIISHDMGIEVLNKDRKKAFACMLQKGEEYPCTYTREFKTSYNNQESVFIEVYEKIDSSSSNLLEENPDAFDIYGSFELTGIPKGPKGSVIEVTFNYDESRTLYVKAEDQKSHVANEVKLHKGQILDNHKTMGATDFYLLLDVSGSMRGRRIDEARLACKKLVEETVDLSVHRLGIITFGSTINVACELTQDKTQLLNAINLANVYGGTSMHGAINTAVDRLQSAKNKKALIIVTDGAPDSRVAAERAAKSAREAGIAISAIGVIDADREYLAQLTANDNLNFEVDDLAKLADVFGQAVENLLSL